jgi:hypothetical protein
MNMMARLVIRCLLVAVVCSAKVHAAGPVLDNAILFVTQVPNPGDFTTIASVFGNHRGNVDSAPRGGDLWIRYPDGTVRNLTREAGFGQVGGQYTNGIAVREPCVHWSGAKAVFSMVIGAPKRQYDYAAYYWQLYEVTNFAIGETPVITKVPNQPANYNNVAPIYGTDERIVFASDRPRSGERHLYPQLDEYEEAPTVTGLWSLDPATADLFLLNHSPSGVFSPSLDSFGRVVFARWDHLQRDQQADTDTASPGSYNTFNYSDESPTALILTNNRTEIFPEPRSASGNANGHTFNQFFPWQINEDGTEEETLNHIGRHEIGGSYRSTSFNDDSNLKELYYFGNRYNTNTVNNFIQMKESPVTPGLFYAVDAPEFYTHASGQLVTLTGAPDVNPDQMRITYLTPRVTANFDNTPPTDHTGLYRNPLPMSNGALVCVHTPYTGQSINTGSSTVWATPYDFRLKTLRFTNGFWAPDQFLTAGLSNSVVWWDPDKRVSYSGLMWELDPVEVRPRAKPACRTPQLGAVEAQVFADEGVEVPVLRAYLQQRDLALIISRNVTARDRGDQQQPFNLRVPGGAQTGGAAGKIYDIAHLQIYQADQIRGLGLSSNGPRAGRRVLAQLMHEPLADNTPDPAGPPASVAIATDGSVAAFVPARRALSWHMTDPAGVPIVRERYWVTFQSGEIRTCVNCHGINTRDQANHSVPTNSPLALRDLLRHWKSNNVPQLATVTTNGADFLAVSFKRQLAATNLSFTVEASRDLVNWITGSSYSAANSTPDTAITREVSRGGAPVETIAVRDILPMGYGTNQFLRVRVSRP